MGETKGVEVIEPGDITSEVLEAIAIIAGRIAGMVFIPCEIGTDVVGLRRELVSIFDKLDVEVTHCARYSTNAALESKLYEGIAFTHRLCLARVKIGYAPGSGGAQ